MGANPTRRRASSRLRHRDGALARLREQDRHAHVHEPQAEQHAGRDQPEAEQALQTIHGSTTSMKAAAATTVACGQRGVFRAAVEQDVHPLAQRAGRRHVAAIRGLIDLQQDAGERVRIASGHGHGVALDLDLEAVIAERPQRDRVVALQQPHREQPVQFQPAARLPVGVLVRDRQSSSSSVNWASAPCDTISFGRPGRPPVASKMESAALITTRQCAQPGGPGPARGAVRAPRRSSRGAGRAGASVPARSSRPSSSRR